MNTSTTSSEISDRIAVMRKKEDFTYKMSDYLSKIPLLMKDNTCVTQSVSEECRLKMAVWCSQVAEFCNFSIDTVSIAMSYLDRYLFSEVGNLALLNRKRFQLSALCAFYIASKLFEVKHLSLSSLVHLSRNVYSEEDMTKMEWEILSSLNWNVHPPTAMDFVHQFLALLPPLSIDSTAKKSLLKRVRVQVDQIVMDYYYVTFNKSLIGVAAIQNALEEMDPKYIPLNTRNTLLRDIFHIGNIDKTGQAFREISDKLQLFLENIPQCRLKHSIELCSAERKSQSRYPSPISSQQRLL